MQWHQAPKLKKAQRALLAAQVPAEQNINTQPRTTLKDTTLVDELSNRLTGLWGTFGFQLCNLYVTHCIPSVMACVSLLYQPLDCLGQYCQWHSHAQQTGTAEHTTQQQSERGRAPTSLPLLWPEGCLIRCAPVWRPKQQCTVCHCELHPVVLYDPALLQLPHCHLC